MLVQRSLLGRILGRVAGVSCPAMALGTQQVIGALAASFISKNRASSSWSSRWLAHLACVDSASINRQSLLTPLGAFYNPSVVDTNGATRPGPTLSVDVLGSAVPPAAPNSALDRYRSDFPATVWGTIRKLFPSAVLPDAVDIGCVSGHGAVELAKRGFRVTGVESDVHLLARARQAASIEGVEVNLVGAAHAKNMLGPGCADLVTVMHGFHLLDHKAALNEIYRLLKADGWLVAAWNDRDLSHEFVQELEDLLESYNPTYSRYSRQHDPDVWLQLLGQGGRYKLHSFEVHPNPMPMQSSASITDLIGSMSFMRPILSASSSARKSFHQDVRALVAAHFGSEPFYLPLESKVYLVKRV